MYLNLPPLKCIVHVSHFFFLHTEFVILFLLGRVRQCQCCHEAIVAVLVSEVTSWACVAARGVDDSE